MNKELKTCPFFDQSECTAFSDLVVQIMLEGDVELDDSRAAYFLESYKRYYCLVLGKVEKCPFMQRNQGDGNAVCDNKCTN